MGLLPSSHPQTPPWVSTFQRPEAIRLLGPSTPHGLAEMPLKFTNTRKLSRHLQVLKKLRDPRNLPSNSHPSPTPLSHWLPEP